MREMLRVVLYSTNHSSTLPTYCLVEDILEGYSLIDHLIFYVFWPRKVAAVIYRTRLLHDNVRYGPVLMAWSILYAVTD